ncbi:MAG: histidine kinase [Lachnospiraceae bacterium]|nr:histidine kinase [Lachnospiraceae bacterium]
MKHLVEWFNCISIKKKLQVLLVVCIFLPLVLTDTFILAIMVNAEKRDDRARMVDTAESTKYIISSFVESSYNFMSDLKTNINLNLFANANFESNLDYYDRYYKINKNTTFANERANATIYSDSPGVVSGGHFKALEGAKEKEWYKQFEKSNNENFIYIDYTKVNWTSGRVFAVISDFNYYDSFLEMVSKNIIYLDLNYSEIVSQLDNAKYPFTIYVCYGDQIVFSNDQKGGIYAPYFKMTDEIYEKVAYKDNFTVLKKPFNIYVLQGENIIWKAIKDNILLILALLSLNVLLPYIVMVVLNRSFTDRLTILTKKLDENESNTLSLINDINGTDEISMLMQSYNDMATRLNNLIETEYKERLTRQETDIARQQAELLALHSQINPHFLFNALESIRMHSVIKKENETARMVEKLAVMQRQNVEWGNDYVTISDEVKFVEAYLELQKYRFGNKLMYEINVNDDCENFLIPKITLVTFVENACIHGMEKKTSSCWIFVRIYKDDKYLVMEIEDTGNGLPDEVILEMLDNINNVNLDMLKGHKGIGILNAALRLKMYSDNKVEFEIESEPGAGTLVTIKLPVRTGV